MAAVKKDAGNPGAGRKAAGKPARKTSRVKNRPELTHVDEHGRARMVDVSEKSVTRREARAEAFVRMSSGTLAMALAGEPKGDVLATATIAGINAAKRTFELIPLCHALRIDSVGVEFEVDESSPGLRVVARVVATDRTGAEMEALTAAAVAALTIYDMCKAAERGVEIEHVRLLFKSGGRSGAWSAGGEA